MRIVLYDREDFEPITILELPPWRNYKMPDGHMIRVAVMPEVSLAPHRGAPEFEPLKIVNIQFERIVRREVTHWLAVTGDTESALLLRAAFLPGQQATVQRREQEAFAKGFYKGLSIALDR